MKRVLSREIRRARVFLVYILDSARRLFSILSIKIKYLLVDIIYSTLKSLFANIIFLIAYTTFFIYSIVSIYSSNYIYSDIEKIPENKTALVLGTSKYLANGRVNMYFLNRIKAAHDLYTNDKVKYILVSGDNRYRTYNEPKLMKEDLIKLGVNPKDIFLDYAGFRTLDSVIRANAIFELTNCTIVSQKFHNERAIFIARLKGINAIGYNAKNVSFFYRLKQLPREILSRVLMIHDLITDRKAYFYGDKIPIEEMADKEYNSENIFNELENIAETVGE